MQKTQPDGAVATSSNADFIQKMKGNGIVIAIINKGERDDGVSRYVIYINEDYICGFIHRRDMGLSECLRAAANAVDLQRKEDEERLIRKISEMDR